MSLRYFPAAVFLGLVLSVGSVAAASSGDIDRQVSVVLEARKKSESESKWLLQHLSAQQKNELIGQQAIIDTLLARSPNPDNLLPDEKLRLWNATKAIDAILDHNQLARDEQLTCTRERSVGTQLPVRVCRTRAERERDREQAVRQTDSWSRRR